MTSGFFHFFNTNAQRMQSRASVSRKNRKGRADVSMKPRRLLTEALEERQLLAVDVTGAATLGAAAEEANVINISKQEISIDAIKSAIDEAAATPGDDVIKIAAGSLKFTSASDEIIINIDDESCGTVTIVAENGDLNIDADGLARVFTVKSGTLKLESVNIANGKADYGGAIANGGTVVLNDVELTDNEATVSGGAIANKGTLVVQNSIVEGNVAAVDGAAIYEGDFEWAKEAAPEWSEIPNVTGGKGQTVEIDLHDYCSEGAWTYSFECSNADSAIFAEQPTIEDGRLTLKFIDNDAYFAEDDYSAVTFEVYATDGKTTAKTSFDVAHECQTSAVLMATFTTMTTEDVENGDYYQNWTVKVGTKNNKVQGYVFISDDEEETTPISEVVESTNENIAVQLWFKDLARAEYNVTRGDGYVGESVWDSYDDDEYCINTVVFYLTLENGTLDLEFDENNQCWQNDMDGYSACYGKGDATYIEDCGETETGARLYKISFGYEATNLGTGSPMPCGQYALLGLLQVNPTDDSKAVSATLTQSNVDRDDPCVVRFYDYAVTRDGSGDKYLRVDPSQTLFVSAVSDSSEPTSEIPGQPFTTALATTGDLDEAPLTYAPVGAAQTKYEAYVSNSLFDRNTASGAGVFAVAEGDATICNTTIADNVVTGAAIYAADGADVNVANSIVVNNGAAPVTSNVVGKNNLVDGTAWDGNVLYDSTKASFKEEGYDLATGSQALNIGDDESAQDFIAMGGSDEESVLLSTDLAGRDRFSATVDAGAYEYQGTAPGKPANVEVSDYVDSAKKPVISWEAPTAVDGVEGYYVYYGDSQYKTTELSCDVTKLTTLEDNSTYEFHVSAFNAYGESSAVSVTLDTLVAPTAPTNLAFGAYADGSATLTWIGVSNAAYYQIKDADGKIVVDNLVDATYTFTGLEDFSTYTYTVVAVNARGSAESESITLDTTVAPATPTGFKVAKKYADNELTLVWDATENATGYIVSQKIDGEWSALNVVEGTTYTVSGLNDFTTYEFAVASYATRDGKTLKSDDATLTTYTAVAPEQPANFKLTAEYAGDGSATVQWDEVENADGYVLAKYEANAWTVVATIDSVGYTINDLANNAEYVYGVASYALDDDGEKLQSDYVSLTINTVVTPDEPTNVKFAEYTGGTSATLTWSAVSGAAGYYVEAQDANGAWTSVATTTETSLEITVAENSKYVYRVAAFNSVGSVTKVSDYVEATLDTLVPPAGDLNLSVVDYSFKSATATLTWNALEFASYYVVDVKVGSSDWTTVEQEYKGDSYNLTNLPSNASCSFRVTAGNAKGRGVVASVDYFTAAPPTTPTVNYSYDKDARTATISYSANFAEEYFVYQGDKLVYQGAGTSYLAENLVDNESYTFKVVASNGQGKSEAAEITFTASAAPQAPVVAIGDYADNAATLTWNAVEFADGYRVYQQNGSAWTQIGSDLGADVLEYTLIGLQDYANYTFAVVAFNDQGESPYSGVVALDTTVAPASPTGLEVSAYVGDGRATLTWDAVEHADGYTIKYGDVEAVVTTNRYDVEGLENYANYEFSVDAFAYRGEEKLHSESATVVLDTTIVPTDELNVAVSEYDYVNNVATLSWNEVAHATGYKITLIEVGVSTNTFDTTDTSYQLSLKDNATYKYSVVAFNGKGDGSTASGEFFTAAPPATPKAAFGAYDADARQATITWNAVDYATSYKVQKYDEGKEDWVDVKLDDPQLTYYTVSNMTDFATYKYRVAASNAKGDSDWCEVSITATTTPYAPTDLDYDYNGKTGQATITWTDDLNPSDVGYKIYQWSEEKDDWEFKANNAHFSNVYVSNTLERYSEYKFAVTSWVKDESGHILESDKEDGLVEVDTNWTPGDIENAWFVDAEKYDGSGEATLVWTPAEGAQWYEIYVYEDGQKVRCATTEETTYTFQGETALANYAEYKFAIVAFNNYEGETGDSSADKIVTFSTMIPPTEDLVVVAEKYDFDADTLKLTWNEVAYADGYKVCLTQDGEEILAETTDESEYTFANLDDNAEYGFKVVAYNVKGDGSNASGKFFTAAPPAAPIDAAFGEYSDTTHKATLSWTEVPYAKGYTVQVKNGESWESVEEFWKTTSYTVSNLVDDSTYVYRVCAINDQGASEYVEAILDTSVKTAPKAPTDLTVNYDSTTDAATLTWTDNSSNETGFIVERSYDANDWKTIATLGANVTSCDLGTLEVGVTYFYRVAATNAYGNSDWDFVSFTIPTPNAPTDLTFGTYDRVNYSVDLFWTDNSDDEQGFKVEWSNDQETWYSDTVAANQTSYTKGKLLEGRTYYFRVSAFNKAGSSDFAVGSFDVPSVERQKPNAPSDVQFVDYDADAGAVTMTWKDNSDDEEKFVVQFSYDQTSWYSVKNVGSNVESLRIEGLVQGRTYYFRVAAYNAAGYSDWSEGAYTVKAKEVAVPTELTVTQKAAETVRLDWNYDPAFKGGFIMQYSYDNVNWSRVKYIDSNTPTIDSNVVYGRSYYFRVAAYYGDTISDWLCSEKYVAPTGTPNAPADLTVDGTATGAKLSWNDLSTNEIGFNLEYSRDGGSTWIALGNVSSDVTTKDVSKLRSGADYTFRVRAYNAYGRSEWASANFAYENSNVPVGPSTLKVGDYSSDSNSIAISWGYDTEEPENVYGYRTQYSYDDGISWYSAGTTSRGDMDSVVSGLVGGRTYKFRVAAYNADGASDWIESESVAIPVSDSAPNAPTELKAGEYDATLKTFELSWKDNSDVEKGYKVEYGVDNVVWNDYAYLEANTTQRDITGLDEGETYYFRVAAYNAYGTSYSDSVKVALDSESGVVAPSVESIAYNPTRRVITLGWSGTASSYNVQYRYCWGDEVSSWYALTNGTTTNEATLKNVTAGVKYEFRVQAVAENGDVSAWSEVESYDTGSMTSSLEEDVISTEGTDFFDELDGDSLDVIAASLL